MWYNLKFSPNFDEKIELNVASSLAFFPCLCHVSCKSIALAPSWCPKNNVEVSRGASISALLASCVIFRQL